MATSVRIFLSITLLILAGCSTAKPYAEASLGYQLNGQTDYWAKTDRQWQCSKNVQFNAEAGLEFVNNWKVGLHHRSWVLCGTGLNENPEIYDADIRVTKKWGGQ